MLKVKIDHVVYRVNPQVLSVVAVTSCPLESTLLDGVCGQLAIGFSLSFKYTNTMLRVVNHIDNEGAIKLKFAQFNIH